MKSCIYPEKPVLLVDDEEQILFSCDTVLRLDGLENIECCRDSRDVFKILETKGAELVLLDLNMPYISGEKLLGKIIEEFPEIPVVVMTGINSVEKAVECMKAGALDYLVKPVEKERLIATVRNALSFSALKRENQLLSKQYFMDGPENPEAFSDIITHNHVMLSIIKYVEIVAANSNPVLISGETGTGKELIANAIHKSSGRKGLFVPVNVAGLDDNMFSDTLFGHEKGAFTGADRKREGLILKAENGTLFLDEIGDLSPQSQVKLLRLIQEREYQPLGSDDTIKTNARIITATNKALERLANEGKFRKDLFYRLKIHSINLPPLRERHDDIPLLLNHFIEKYSKELNKKKPSYPKELVRLVESYAFPGNIREMEGIVADALSRHKSHVLSLETFKEHMQNAYSIVPDAVCIAEPTGAEEGGMIDFGDKLPALKDIQKLLIDEALRRSKGNKNRAAELLQTSRQALNWHINK